ncbi:MAG: uracil-xanthine permease [Bacteriovoracaceae bacterium]|nr:uracil-xanthine permease [Bacteriovoracaceae bacterium]
MTHLKTLVIGIQMLFVAFGALVLVPLLTGLDPSIALFSAGIGTLIFHFVTKNKVPVFLASSFAFIAPIKYGMDNFGVAETLGGLVCTGLVYIIFSFIVKKGGVKMIERYLPAVVTGPVIMVIGLKLTPVAVNMAKSFDGSGTLDNTALIISMLTLACAIVVVIFGNKFFSLIPVLISIVFGYVVALIFGVVDFTPIKEAAWFSLPWVGAIASGAYAFPQFSWNAILYIVPVALAPAIEHVGDVLAISSATGEKYIEDPGLHRTLLGDGIATSFAGLVGGPPNTTYSEVTGAVALTKAFNPLYMRIAAVTAIVLAFVGKLGAILKTIPVPVMGGIMILLFGMIAAIGVGNLIRAKVDMTKARNLVIASIILVFGLGDLSFTFGAITLGGIGLAGLIGIILNIIIPIRD